MSEIDDESYNRSASAPTSPTSQSPTISNNERIRKGHRVNFPDDNQIVTGYFDAPSPWGYNASQALETLVDSYKLACDKQGIKPIAKVLKQLENLTTNDFRKQDLSLKGEKLDYKQCEALEEIFKRIQFRFIDLESCDLDGEGASALFDMMEYYESATHLNISNIKAIGMLGWQALCRMLKKTSCLQYLDLSYTGLNEQILLILGRAIRIGSQLVTLHLENAGLYGRRLAILVAALKLNTNLKELYLGDNKIASADGVQIGNLLRSNSCLEVIDLRRNHLQDLGLDHICEGLSHQTSNLGDGLKVLNLSENQITCRGIHRLSETMSLCNALKALNLSSNYLGNDGICILKTGLLSNQSLKYLSLKNTQVTSEGAIAIAEFITESKKITQIDLSENDIQDSGLMALALSSKHNSSLIELKLYENLFEKENLENGISNTEELLKEIKKYCKRNKSALSEENMESEFMDRILFCDAHSDTFTKSHNQPLNEIKVNSFLNYSEEMDVVDSGLSNTDESYKNNQSNNNKQDRVSDQEIYYKQIIRSTSLGSWESLDKNTKKSGRFSVSPVNLCTENDMKIQIKDNDVDESKGQDNSPVLENENSDKLTDLPKKFSLSIPESSCPPSRRMSTPALSLNISSAKPKSKVKTKICRNLDSLDLKSSIPVSPTFFARFEFPDPVLLKLPPEVEEVIFNLIDEGKTN